MLVPHGELVKQLEGLFKQYKKSKAILAYLLEKDTVIETLEGETLAKAGQYLCTGYNGAKWTCEEFTLYNNYNINVDDEDFSPVVLRRYETKEDVVVYAAQVPNDITVKTSWGFLTCLAGSYVVTAYIENGVAAPVMTWIVNKDLFDATYNIVPCA